VANQEKGWHTLCLLDIKVKEQSIENLMRGRKIYEPPRYMSVSQAAEQLLEIVENKQKSGDNSATFNKDTLCVGLARIGSETQVIKCGTLEELTKTDLGPPLHSLIITGKTHPLELDMLKLFAVNKDTIELAQSKVEH
ncbi:unnamed protein product, partial [Owenia fusiformis]